MAIDNLYIEESAMVWETIPSNIDQYQEDIVPKVKYVTSPLPQSMVLTTRAEQLFSGEHMWSLFLLRVFVYYPLTAEKLKSKLNGDEFFELMDNSKPIDILFFGNRNEHRAAIEKDFLLLAKRNNLRVEFHMSYALFGNKLNAKIKESKVVLNLANMNWPCDDTENGVDEENCIVYAMNLHRVRSLLGKGKVVLSERTGSVEEESLYNGVVKFAFSNELTRTALELIRSPSKRWELEQNARKFMIEDLFSARISLPNCETVSDVCHCKGRVWQESSLSAVSKALLSVSGKQCHICDIMINIIC